LENGVNCFHDEITCGSTCTAEGACGIDGANCFDMFNCSVACTVDGVCDGCSFGVCIADECVELTTTVEETSTTSQTTEDTSTTGIKNNSFLIIPQLLAVGAILLW